MLKTISAMVVSTLITSPGAWADSGDSNCFTAGTQVATAEGYAPIEDLRVGDGVLAWDFERRRPVVQTVSRTHRATATEFLSLRAGDYAIDAVTPHHPFWVPSRAAWVEAGDLRVGEAVAVRSENGRLVSEPLDEVERWTGQETAVFTISVGGTPMFFAGDFLVHNKSPAEGCKCSAASWQHAGWFMVGLAVVGAARRREW